MNKTDKLALIDGFESAVDALVDFVKAVPAEAIDFRPALAGAWTVREHAVHFLDADTFAYGRLRTAVTEPGAEVFVWDEDAWQAKGHYETTQALAALEACRALRRVAAAMARTLADEDWESYYVRHRQFGRLSLADVLKTYTDHAQFHLNYFRRNLDAFKTRG